MRTYASREKKPTSQALPKPESVVKPLSIEGSPIQAKSNEEGLAEWEAQRQKWARLGSPWMDKVPNPSGDLAQPWIQRKQQLGNLPDRSEQVSEQDRLQKLDATQIQHENPPRDNCTGMPDRLKLGLEELSGLDLSGVRVHRHSTKPAQLSAHAYAQGQTIELGPGQERHLPHEGWHVVQQMQGRVKPTIAVKGYGVNDNHHLEREADAMGAKAMQRSLVRCSKVNSVHVKGWEKQSVRAISSPDTPQDIGLQEQVLERKVIGKANHLPRGCAQNSHATIQRAFNESTYRLGPNVTRKIYVEAGEFIAGNLQQANLDRAVLHETMVRQADGVGLATRYSNATTNFTNAVGLTVALNDYYQKPNQIQSKQQGLQNKARQMVNACQSPLNVVKVLWQDGRQNQNDSIRAEVPFAELRRRAANDAGAKNLYNQLKTQATTVWRKMGDDDMPFPNPNNADLEVNQQLAQIEKKNANFGDMGNLVSFSYNLIPDTNDAIIRYLCSEIYKAEAHTIDKISSKYKIRTYAIEPTTYYRASNNDDASASWVNYEQSADQGSKQIKEGASFAKSLDAKENIKQQYIALHEPIPTSAGGRLVNLVNLFATATNPQHNFDKDKFWSKLYDELRAIDQSIWDEETLTRGSKWMYRTKNEQEGIDGITKKINEDIRKDLNTLISEIIYKVQIIRGLRQKYPKLKSDEVARCIL